MLLLPVMPAHAAVSVTDATGHPITLKTPAQRIVALTPHLVENLYTAGLGDRLVGAVRYSDHPAAARAIPRVGGYRSVSLEAILDTHPDLVVAWAQSAENDLVARLRGLGIPVYVDDPKTFDDIAESIRDFGRLGNTRDVADPAARRFAARMKTLGQRYAGRRPVSVFYVVATEPLITVADSSMIGAAIRLCGGRNIYADAGVAAPHVGIESLVARDPDVIVQTEPEDTPGRPNAAFWHRWSTLSAVRQDHFVTLSRDAISRPTVRMAGATAALCQGLDETRDALTPVPASSPRE